MRSSRYRATDQTEPPAPRRKTWTGVAALTLALPLLLAASPGEVKSERSKVHREADAIVVNAPSCRFRVVIHDGPVQVELLNRLAKKW